jgi:FkbM family methyltransferase
MPIQIKQLIKKTVYSLISPPVTPASFSQAGEDAILRFLFADKKIGRISYLEIGTNVPDYGNNTYLFYCNGSRGVCVEADKRLIPDIRKVRPEDRILNVGVAARHEKEADFYLFDCKGINTFNKEEAQKRASSGNYKITGVVKVPLVDINSLISDNFDRYPDLLSIDIEGLDLPVLMSLAFDQYPIPVICAETCMYSENHIRIKNTAVAEFMLSQGYEAYADTYINTIFVNKSWFYQS